MNNLRYIVHRYEIYGNPPNGKIVGFLIINEDTKKSEYVETNLTYLECKDKSDNLICETAFQKCKPQIDIILKNLTNINPIIGSEYIP